MKLALHMKLLLVAILLPLASLLAATGSVADDSFLTPEVKLTAAENASEFSQFGWAVSIGGDTSVVGVPFKGKAYVFSRTDSGWDNAPITLEPTAPSQGPFGFGYSVSASDDGKKVLVGAPFLGAYVFEKEGMTWVPTALPSDGMGFGWSVAISGDMAVVGNPIQVAAHVFEKEDGIWVPKSTLHGESWSGFGSTVAVSAAMRSGDKLVAVGTSTLGAAYVFTCPDNPDNMCEEEPEVMLTGGSMFGSSVAISGDNLAVASPAEGKVYVYTKEDDDWVPKPTLDGELASEFGSSVAISGATLVVGAPKEYLAVPDPDDPLPEAGVAYVFRFDERTSQWAQQAKLAADDAQPYDSFGRSVAVNDTAVIAGAHFHNVPDPADPDEMLPEAGAAYVFNLPSVEEDGPLVEILSVSTDKEYSLGTAEVGAYPYIDRHYKIQNISHRLEGSVLVATANDDKWVRAYDHLQLKLNRGAELFVAYDKRGACRRPSWLREDGWVRTNEYIETSDWPASPLEVYKKFIEVDGEPVIETLAGNHYGGDTRARSNYFVLVKPPQEDIVSIESVSSDKPYSLAAARKGARPYIDRPYRIKGIGAALNGGVLVCTANNDKWVTVADHLRLRINQDAEVFVLYDKRGAHGPPDWLEDGWERTHDFIKTSYWPSSPMKVFKRFVKIGDAPEIITLGGNRSGGGKRARCNYFVIVKKPEERIVDIVRVSTGKPYSFSTAQIGTRPYIDRGYKITEMSSGLEEGMLLQTANDDKWVSEPDHLILNSTAPVDVYVCYDKRGSENLPGWLDNPNWTLTDFSVETTDRPASPLVVLKTEVDAGEIILGGNHSGGDTGARSNYFVIIKQ